MIEPDYFVREMNAMWTDQFGNESSPKLRLVWRSICETFNEHITQGDRRWRILQPATGSGKTQSLRLYCALLSKHAPDTGVLVITRLIEQADKLAAEINETAGTEIAVARHSKNKLEVADIQRYPVLVLTHNSYIRCLDALNAERGFVWEAFATWERGERQLVVIDEAIDLVAEARIDLESLELLKMIPAEVRAAHPEAGKTLRYLHTVISKMIKQVKNHQFRGNQAEERITWKGMTGRELEFEQYVDMLDSREQVCTELRDLRKDCRAVKWDEEIVRLRQSDVRQSIGQRIDHILYSIEEIFCNWAFYSNDGGRHTMNTARLVVPDCVPGAVVLDATAQQNLLWHLFDERAQLVKIPANPRRYDNVTMHLLRANGVGKRTMQGLKGETADRLAASIAKFGTDRRVLVVTHKDNVPMVRKAQHPFQNWEVANWAAVDGRNDWQEFDTVVIFGLMFRPPSNSANLFFALRGLQNSAWLNNEDQRAYGDYPDVRQAIRYGQLSVDVIQAINRVRCRRVIDANGNCEPVDVFIQLPGGQAGNHILAEIREEMPGIKTVQDWDYRQQKIEHEGGRRDYKESLVAYMRNQPRGQTKVSMVKQFLGCSPRTWRNLTAEMSDDDSGLFGDLARIGCRYQSGGPGRGKGSVIVKTAV